MTKRERLFGIEDSILVRGDGGNKRGDGKINKEMVLTPIR
jgi:hypothetical protein